MNRDGRIYMLLSTIKTNQPGNRDSDAKGGLF